MVSEWKITLTDPTGGAEKIVITGYGKDPHHPIDIATTAKGRTARRLLEDIKECVSLGMIPISLEWLAQSRDDMYLWEFCAKASAGSYGWQVHSILPKPTPPPLSEEEKEMIKELGYVIY